MLFILISLCPVASQSSSSSASDDTIILNFTMCDPPEEAAAVEGSLPKRPCHINYEGKAVGSWHLDVVPFDWLFFMEALSCLISNFLTSIIVDWKNPDNKAWRWTHHARVCKNQVSDRCNQKTDDKHTCCWDDSNTWVRKMFVDVLLFFYCDVQRQLSDGHHLISTLGHLPLKVWEWCMHRG